MPDLDVSFVVSDPMLCDFVRVTRIIGDSTQGIDQKGRATLATEQYFDNVPMVLTHEAPNMLDRGPDYDVTPKKIFGATSFAIRGESTGYKPDVVTWGATDYMVVQVLPYSRYGAGTYEFVAQTFQAVDAPVDQYT